jgi:hypothetical protein
MKPASVRSMCVLALLHAVIGCSEDGTGPAGGAAGTGGTGGTAGAAGTGGDGGMVRTYRFYITDSSGVALEGVRVCQADTDHCATTDDLGQVSLDLPANRAVMITKEKEGYGSLLQSDLSDEDFGPVGGGTGHTTLYTDAELEAIADQLQTTYPWPQGMVGLVRWPPISGVTFTPVGSTVDAVGDSFYYDGESGEYRLDLEATTAFYTSSNLPLGQGGFVDVTPGVHEFEFGGTAGDCARTGWAWPGDAPNRIRAPVRAGFMTYASIICNE